MFERIESLGMSHFNLRYFFDDKLREIPESPSDVLNYISDQNEKLKLTLAPIERVKILGEIGSYARILNRLNDAESFLSEAIALIDKHDLGVKLWVVNAIRLAHVYQWMGAYEVAEEMFFNIVKMCQERQEVAYYLNFSLQHFGKLYFELSDYQKALGYFQEALELRKALGDEKLIQSSQLAINVTKKNISASDFSGQ